LVPFFLPLFFGSGTHLLINFGIIKITSHGLHLGSLIALRIIFLIMTSALLMRTTSPPQLVNALSSLLRPLRVVGIKPQRIAALLSMAWTAVPHLWTTTRDTVTATDFKKIKNIKGLLPLLSNLIATLYLKTEPDNTLWTQTSPQEALDSKSHAYRREG
jgi:energy-coupling factor transport system permease protein